MPTPVSPTAFVKQVRAALEPRANAPHAAVMAAYMRNQFGFLGLKKPERDLLVKPLMRAAVVDADEKWLAQTARKLWLLPEREYVYVAVDLLRVGNKRLTVESLDLVEELLPHRAWWDSVDGLAGHVLSPLVLRLPELRDEMDRWIEHENFWMRRAAILHQLAHGRATDSRRLFAYCASQAAEKEFFIRKAIGWALRQYARVNSVAVRKFVESHPELSALSRREAMKRMEELSFARD